MKTWQGNLLTLAVVALTLSLVVYPQEAFEASVYGLRIFGNVVFPSLLPFFVLSELLLGLGFVHFMGVLFEPLMRPLFGVPGAGAFALSMGLAAGYPMDAVITGKFRRAGMCTRVEGERLLAFTNTADPLFMFGAVAVGMFGLPRLGVTLAIAHYLSSFLVGLAFKLHGVGERGTPEVGMRRGSILARAFQAMIQARAEDGRPFGRMLGDAVTDSVKTLLMIGGFIMTFSVLIKVLQVAGWARILSLPLDALFIALGLDLRLVPATLQGIFEIDLGTVAASQAAAPFVQKVLIASAIIAWSGFSVHGQVASVLTGTDIRMGPYIVARLLHAVLAAILTALLLTSDAPIQSGPLAPPQVPPVVTAPAAVPAAAPATLTPAAYAPDFSALTEAIGQGLPVFTQHLTRSVENALLVPLVLAVLAVLVGLWQRFGMKPPLQRRRPRGSMHSDTC